MKKKKKKIPNEMENIVLNEKISFLKLNQDFKQLLNNLLLEF